jgi:uncharacterized membrane-anchored protein YitT (DUF2179 family)
MLFLSSINYPINKQPIFEEREMSEEKSIKNFEPLEIMGYFWMILGVLVLIVTPFVEENSYVPMIRGIMTNIVSGGIMVGIGIFAIFKGRHNRRNQTKN